MLDLINALMNLNESIDREILENLGEISLGPVYFQLLDTSGLPQAQLLTKRVCTPGIAFPIASSLRGRLWSGTAMVGEVSVSP